MEKPKTVYDMVKEIEDSFSHIKNFQMKNLIRASEGFYIVMDKKFNWYLGIVNKINTKYDLLYDHYTDPNREYYKFRLYDILKNTNIQNKETFIARLDFSLNEEISALPNDIKLEYIYVNKEYTKISLGSNLIKILELIALNLNIFEIQGNFSPFGYAKKNGVAKFYEENGFEIRKETKHLAGKIFEKKIIEKKLSTSVIESLKQKIMNFPTQNKIFTVLLSDKILVESNYNNKEL